MNVVYLGNFKVEPENKISLFNPTFLYGINVFEGIRAYWSNRNEELRVFDLNEHLERLYNSAKVIGLKPPLGKYALRKALLSILEKEVIRENIYIRITFFISGNSSWSEENLVEWLISIRSIESNFGLEEPQSLAVSSFRRISSISMPPSVKAAANYLNSRYALLEAKQRGFEGALFLSQDGYISESTGSCVFFIKNGELFTPSTSCDILVGITRNRIIEIAKSCCFEVHESEITTEELVTFEGAFLAGTMIELKPVSRIERFVFNPSHEVILKLSMLLKNYVYGIQV